MKKVVTNPLAEIALRGLDNEDGRQVHTWFDRLRNWDNDEFVRTHSPRLEGIAGAPCSSTTSDIRIFFRIDGNTITVLDVARKAAILATGESR